VVVVDTQTFVVPAQFDSGSRVCVAVENVRPWRAAGARNVAGTLVDLSDFTEESFV